MSNLNKTIINLFNAKDIKARESLVSNPITADEVLESFIDDESFKVFMNGSSIFDKILNHKNVSKKTLATFYSFCKEKDASLKKDLIETEAILSEDEKANMSSKLEILSSYIETLENDKALEKFLILISQDEEKIRVNFDFRDENDRMFLIHNKNCPDWVLSEIVSSFEEDNSNDDKIEFYEGIARNPNVSGTTLIKLENMVSLKRNYAFKIESSNRNYAESIWDDLRYYGDTFESLDEETQENCLEAEDKVEFYENFRANLEDLLSEITANDKYIDIFYKDKREFESKLDCLDYENTSSDELLSVLTNYLSENILEYEYDDIFGKIINHPNANYDTLIEMIDFVNNSILEIEDELEYYRDEETDNYLYSKRSCFTRIVDNLLGSKLSRNLLNELNETNDLMQYSRFFDKLDKKFINEIFDNENCTNEIINSISTKNIEKGFFSFLEINYSHDTNMELLNVLNDFKTYFNLKEDLDFKEEENLNTVNFFIKNILNRENEFFENISYTSNIEELRDYSLSNNYYILKEVLNNPLCDMDILKNIVDSKDILKNRDLIDLIIEHKNSNLELLQYIYENAYLNVDIKDFIKNEKLMNSFEQDFMIEIMEFREKCKDKIISSYLVSNYIDEISKENDLDKLKEYFDLDSPFVKMGLAQNENINAEIMQSLSFEKDERIIHKLLINPSCSRDIIDRYIKDEEYIPTIIKSIATPDVILKKFVDEPKYSEDLSLNPNTSLNTLKKLKEIVSNDYDLANIFNHPNANDKLRQELFTLDENEHITFFEIITGYLDEITYDENVTDYEKLTFNLSKDEVKLFLDKLENSYLKEFLIRNEVEKILTQRDSEGISQNEVDNLFEKFINDENVEIRVQIARVIKDEDLLSILINDDNIDVVYNVIHNKYCTSNLLEDLVKTDNMIIKDLLAGNNWAWICEEREEPLNYKIIFENMFKNNLTYNDSSYGKIPFNKLLVLDAQKIFERLSVEENLSKEEQEIKKVLDKYFNVELQDIPQIKDKVVLDVLSFYGGNDILKGLAQNENCSDDVFKRIIKRGNNEVVLELVKNNGISEEIAKSLLEREVFKSLKDGSNQKVNYSKLSDVVLEVLLKENNTNLTRNLLGIKDCPEFILEKVAFGDDEKNRTLALRHPNMTGDLLEVITDYYINDKENLLKLVENPNLYPETLGKIAMKDDIDLNVRIALHPNANEDILCFLSGSDNHNVKLGVFNNENCPSYLVNQLAYNLLIEEARTEILLNNPEYIEQFEKNLSLINNTHNENYSNLFIHANCSIGYKAEIAKSLHSTGANLENLYKDNIINGNSYPLNILIASNLNTPGVVFDMMLENSKIKQMTGMMSTQRFERLKGIIESNPSYIDYKENNKNMELND